MSGFLYSVYIINKAGGLVYQRDHSISETEISRQFNYPTGLVLKELDEKLVVSYGEKNGIKVGHSFVAINGEYLSGKYMPNGELVQDYLKNEKNFPANLTFCKPKLTTNERIMLASMFHSLFAISCKLSPVERSSGIELLETNSFKLHCFQSITGVKFLVLTDPRVMNMDAFLKKLYEFYSDFALKNPFYSLEMPIRCDLFDTNLQKHLEQTEKSIAHGVNS